MRGALDRKAQALRERRDGLARERVVVRHPAAEQAARREPSEHQVCVGDSGLLATAAVASRAGLRAGVAVAPVLPGLTDAPASLAAVMRAARDAGATHVWWNLLNLRPGTREHFLSVLGEAWPAERQRYERLYPAGGSGYLPAAHAEPIERRLSAVRAGSGIRDRRSTPIEPGPPPEQLLLAM